MSSRRVRDWVISTILGCAAALPYTLSFLIGRSSAGPREVVALAVYALIFFVVLSYVVTARLILPTLQVFGWSWRAWLVASAGAGIVLAFLMPIRIMDSLPSFHRLEIVNTGVRNPQAQGTEVWLIGLPKGLAVDEAALSKSAWKRTDGAFFSQGESPTALYFAGWLGSDDSVKLRTHSWSGIAQYRWDEDPYQTIDLFAIENHEVALVAPTQAWAMPGLLSSVLWVCNALWMGYVVTGIALFAFRFRQKSTSIS